MMVINSKHMHGMNIVLILVIAYLVQGSKDKAIQLKIAQRQNYTIPASQTRLFKFTIDNVGKDPNINFYISIQSDTKNFFKRPAVQINSNDNFSLNCYDSGEKFTDLCSIDNEDMQSHRNFSMSISCVLECTLQIHLYFQSAYLWKANDVLALNAPKYESLAEQFVLPVPQEDFTSIQIIARLKNFQHAEQGVFIRANYGSSDIDIPTLYNYTQKGISLWNNAQGIIIPKQKLKKNDEIKILIVVPQGMEVILRNNIVNGSKYMLNLNQQIGDVIAANQYKMYQVNLNENQQKELKNLTLNIKMASYSGDPKINIGFEEQFVQKQISSPISASGAINYPITALQRQKNGFNGELYIKVTCDSDCAYQIAAETSQKNYILLDLQSTQVQKILSDEVANYFYEERISVQKSLQQLIVSYKLKIQIISGQIQIALGRCKQLQETYNISKCIVNSSKQMISQKVKDRFSEINATVKKTSNVYEVTWQMNVKQCPILESILIQPDQNIHVCEYQFVTSNIDLKDNKTRQSYYALTLTSGNQITWLRQGHIIRGTVLQGLYEYFALQVTNIPQVEQVAFYLTVLQGKVLMVGSTQNKFPSIFSSTISQRNSLIFQGDKRTAIYYVAIFGTETTDFTLIASTKMTVNEFKSGITLQQNVIFNYTLFENQTQAIFYINAEPKEYIKLQVYGLQGNISYTLRRSQNDNVNQSDCSNNPQEPCFFMSNDKNKFILTVKGSASGIQTFTILYRDIKDQKCIEHPMNQPIFMSLFGDTLQCIEFVLDKPKKIQLSLSIQSIKLFSNNLQAYVTVNENKLKITQRSLQLTPTILASFCNGSQAKFNETMKFSNCTLKITLKSQSNLDLGLIIQDQNTQFTLFEGIQQRIIEQNTNVDNIFKKYFVFNIYTKWAGLNLLLMSYTHATYNISIKTIKQTQYNSYKGQQKDIFPTYANASMENNTITQSSAQKFIMINISPEIYSKQQEPQILLITVQGKINQSQKSAGYQKNVFLSFDIQIVRFQAELQIGQAKVGFVEQNDMKIYTISQGSYKSVQVSLTTFYSDSCAFISFIKQEDKKQSIFFQNKNFAILNDSSSKYIINVIGLQDCSYQLTVKDLSIPVAEITTSMPIYIESNETQKFLYNHISTQNFDIVQRLASGDSNIYVRSISYSQNLSQILKLSTERYSTNNQADKTGIRFDKNNPNFCFNCLYLIAVVPNPIVKQQLVIVLDQQRIPLKQNFVVKLHMQYPYIRKFVYHSKTNFNIQLTQLNGNISYEIRGKLLPSNLKDNKSNFLGDTIPIQIQKIPQDLQNKRLDEFDDIFRFEIDISGYQNSAFAISINKNNTYKTITTGVPAKLTIINNEKVGVKFKKLENTEQIIIRVQIVADHLLAENEYEFLLEYDQKLSAVQKDRKKTPMKINQIENSFQIISSGVAAQYYFYIIPKQESQNQSAIATILLEGYRITHLKSGLQSAYSQNTTFQLFANRQSMMIEVFQCEGKVQITGTSNLSNLNDNERNNSQMMLLQHWNDGGHYVVSAQLYYGLYFISVNSTNSSQKPLYLVRYHKYQQFDNLYRQFNFVSNILFSQEKEFISFMIKPILLVKYASISVKIAQYTLIIGLNPKTIQKVSQCSMGMNDVLTSINSVDGDSLNSEKQVVFELKRDQIQKLMTEKDSRYFYVGAVAQVMLDNKNLPRSLYFNFQPIQMSLSQRQTITIFNGKGNEIVEILIYLMIPFLIGSTLIFLSCRYFIRRVYSLYPSRLVEDDPVGQSQQGIQQNAQHDQIK